MKKIITFILLSLSSLGICQTTDNPEFVKPRNAKKLATAFLKTHNIPGMSISVSKHGKLIWSKGFGYANKKPRIKVKPNKTIFRIASISKSITGVTLAKLTDDKLIDLDKSVYYYLPDYPKKAYDFTVRQLGGNIAGIRHYKNDTEYALNKKMSITEGLSLFKNDDLLFEPGSQYKYSSLGYVLLSEIIQKVTKIPFKTFVLDSIFNPLEMNSTMIDGSDTNIPNKTHFYRASSIRRFVYAKPVSNEYKVASGGFLSTSEDIVKFGNEIIFPKLLSQLAISEIVTSQKLNNGNKTGYGIGFSVEKSKNGTPKYYHTGGGVGASTILLIYPQEELVITVLTNLTGVNMKEFGGQLEAFFMD
tara:strand:+ start:15523 stop:16602 length:1080 start_codon:yes stop_codon:yes gene_type:complete